MNAIEVIEALCRIAQEAISAIRDEQIRESLEQALDAAIGEEK